MDGIGRLCSAQNAVTMILDTWRDACAHVVALLPAEDAESEDGRPSTAGICTVLLEYCKELASRDELWDTGTAALGVVKVLFKVRACALLSFIDSKTYSLNARSGSRSQHRKIFVTNSLALCCHRTQTNQNTPPPCWKRSFGTARFLRALLCLFLIVGFSVCARVCTILVGRFLS